MDYFLVGLEKEADMTASAKIGNYMTSKVMFSPALDV